jgi:hypothetical protein
VKTPENREHSVILTFPAAVRDYRVNGGTGISQYFGNNGRMVEYRGGIHGAYVGQVIIEARKFQREVEGKEILINRDYSLVGRTMSRTGR